MSGKLALWLWIIRKQSHWNSSKGCHLLHLKEHKSCWTWGCMDADFWYLMTSIFQTSAPQHPHQVLCRTVSRLPAAQSAQSSCWGCAWDCCSDLDSSKTGWQSETVWNTGVTMHDIWWHTYWQVLKYQKKYQKKYQNKYQRNTKRVCTKSSWSLEISWIFLNASRHCQNNLLHRAAHSLPLQALPLSTCELFVAELQRVHRFDWFDSQIAKESYTYCTNIV